MGGHFRPMKHCAGCFTRGPGTASELVPSRGMHVFGHCTNDLKPRAFRTTEWRKAAAGGRTTAPSQPTDGSTWGTNRPPKGMAVVRSERRHPIWRWLRG